MNILKKVFLTIEGYDLIRPNETVVLAVSGGPDSVAMLHILRDINKMEQLGWKMHVAHFNHGIRGKAADEDEEFVRQLAAKLDVPFHVEHANVKGLKEGQKVSLEEAGRNARLSYLGNLGMKLGAQKVALGHNMDDQAETILHRIIRGTGLRGLKGMSPIRLISRKHDLFFVRPLVELERHEIETYLRERQITFRIDQSNADISITRNRLRHKLIPLIESEFNPRVKSALVKLGQTAGSFYLLLREIANEVYENAKMLAGEGEVCLSVEEFAKLPPAIQTLIIDKAVKTVLGIMPQLHFEHYLEIIGLCDERSFHKAVRLPKGLEARRESYLIKIYKPKEEPPPLKFTSRKLRVPGSTVIRKLNIEIEAEIEEGKILGLREYVQNKDFSEEAIDLEKVTGALQVRLRRKGDSFLPLGARGSCKLKKFFIDNKVPRSMRDRVPIVADGKRIVWVVGYRIGDDVKITEATQRVLKLKVKRLDEGAGHE
ncbi:MAG: tRNA lysidine(34) synthetase TilS [Planctomycetes bacterium]|nr:tRNA lysidine(34) synthetase TilS [Planctomycetota bacterium]